MRAFRIVLEVTIASFGGLIQAQELNIIPQPNQVTWLQGKEVKVKKPRITVNPVLNIPKEGYELTITGKGTIIQASDSAGAFYGTITLDQLPERLQPVKIIDAPRLPYRGMMVDMSRHFKPKDWVLKQIDAMAGLKLNRLHLHLTDAAGWRMEIKQYPRLTSYAAWRPYELWKDWNANGWKYAEEGSENAYGGYFTQDDLREIVAYAAKNHIVVIPEIEMPSHSEEITAAYPFLACDSTAQRSSDVCPGKETTYEFLENVLTEVLDVFPSKDIHIGGDEAGKGAWKKCPDCAAKMKELGTENVDDLQSYLINRIGKFLDSKGRRLVGWDEILDGDKKEIPSVIMIWHGLDKATQAMKEGHDVVLTPGGYCYFDSYQDAPYSQPQAFGGYLPLEKVYSFDPLPDSLGTYPGKIIGLQGNLWCELISTPEYAEYMLYPRMYALAEDAWTAPANKEWNDFYRRALFKNEMMKAGGYNPFDMTKEVGNRPQAKEPVNHLARGKKVIYNEPWWDWYPANRYETLTDGLQGGWNYTDGRWQGFLYYDNERMDVTIDLEKVTPIHSISTEFMQFCGPGVWFPDRVEFLISDDGKEFTLLKALDWEQVQDEAVSFQERKWEGDAKTRYVRVRATSPQGCLFASEVIVL